MKMDWIDWNGLDSSWLVRNNKIIFGKKTLIFKDYKFCS